MYWLTQSRFQDSYYSIGAGASLQPLLRYSDRFSKFLFIEFDTSSGNYLKYFKRSIAQFQELADDQHLPAPLVLDSVEVLDQLQYSDFELALSPVDALNELNDLLSTQERRIYQNTFGVSAEQYGIKLLLRRRIQYVDGTIEERPIELRVAGGEGIIAYIAMGGLNRAPRYVETVQTGASENHAGPLANLFAQQISKGAEVPEVWIRGTESDYHNRRTPRPAPPFDKVGQNYANWRGDRSWPNAPSKKRHVKAWIHSIPSTSPIRIGAHTIYPQPVDLQLIKESDSACLPVHLAEKLGVTELGHVVFSPRSEKGINSPLSKSISKWQQSLSFKNANQVVFIPSGYEDELSVLVAWLITFDQPVVSIYLPLPLDFSAMERAYQNAALNHPGF